MNGIMRYQKQYLKFLSKNSPSAAVTENELQQAFSGYRFVQTNAAE